MLLLLVHILLNYLTLELVIQMTPNFVQATNLSFLRFVFFLSRLLITIVFQTQNHNLISMFQVILDIQI